MIRNVARDLSLSEIRDTLPFVVLMTIAVIVLCIFPGIATVLPDSVMGREAVR